MAFTLVELSPYGAVGDVATGSGNVGTYNYQGPHGDQGHGWSGQFSITNTILTAGWAVRIPSNARELSVTYAYNGAATVTFNLSGSNDTVANVIGATAIFGPIAATFAPQILGGTAGSTAQTAVISAPPLFLSGKVGGTGAVGGDTITITVSCLTIVRP